LESFKFYFCFQLYILYNQTGLTSTSNASEELKKWQKQLDLDCNIVPVTTGKNGKTKIFLVPIDALQEQPEGWEPKEEKDPRDEAENQADKERLTQIIKSEGAKPSPSPKN